KTLKPWPILVDHYRKCKQFTRTKENNKDLCGAWEQPTTADRQACQFYIPKNLSFFQNKESSKL
ncbi:hypothetical protein K6U55_08615, partial [Vibrio diabolicus]|uniref:hypothetical protein n=1 Tax=Vibrio diabolicus TaxID=50719 RepID=UPI00211AF3D1